MSDFKKLSNAEIMKKVSDSAAIGEKALGDMVTGLEDMRLMALNVSSMMGPAPSQMLEIGRMKAEENLSSYLDSLMFASEAARELHRRAVGGLWKPKK